LDFGYRGTVGVEWRLMMYRFGVTEISKGDAEIGRAEHVEKSPNTQVHESTADAARAAEVNTATVNEKEVQI
jgi:hypothetical protein